MVTILEDSTDTLYADIPANFRGIPASVVVRVQTQNQTLPTSTEAATVGTTELNTNAAATAGARALSFAGATTVTAGRAYLAFPNGAADAADLPEAFIVRFTDSGTTSLTLAEPLPTALASGAGLIPYFVSFALDTTETATGGIGFAEWTMTDGASVDHKWVQDFRVALARVAYALNSTDLTKLRPIAAKLRPAEDADFVETLEASWRHLEMLLRAAGMVPALIRSLDALKEPHADACIVHMLRQAAGSDRAELREEWESVLRNSWEATLAGRAFWYDDGDDLSDQQDTQDTSRLGLDFSL